MEYFLLNLFLLLADHSDDLLILVCMGTRIYLYGRTVS